MDYLWAFLLFIVNAAAWLTCIVMLPGNWIMVAFTALFAFLLPEEGGRGVSLTVLGVAAGLAALGEVIELTSGAAGALRQGASRRAAVLAVIGALTGAIAGALLMFPILFIGPILGAIVGGSVGAFLGAYLGESWKGKERPESLSVGGAAMWGQLLGMCGKLTVGAIILVIVTIDSFF
ncbi:MAG: DUF456 domain-containing protein [bacterium]